MNLHGYAKEVTTENPLTLREVSFEMSPEELEKVAAFLVKAAKQIRSGELAAGGHRHIDEIIKGWKTRELDIIVLHPEAYPAPLDKVQGLLKEHQTHAVALWPKQRAKKPA